jgi:hypothetical protein
MNDATKTPGDTPTPRTAAVTHDVMTWEKGSEANSPLIGNATGWIVVDADFARQLERELAAAQEAAKYWEEKARRHCVNAGHWRMGFDAARAAVAEFEPLLNSALLELERAPKTYNFWPSQNLTYRIRNALARHAAKEEASAP